MAFRRATHRATHTGRSNLQFSPLMARNLGEISNASGMRRPANQCKGQQPEWPIGLVARPEHQCHGSTAGRAGLPCPTRPVHPRTDLHAIPTAGGRDRRESRTSPRCAAGTAVSDGQRSRRVRLGSAGPRHAGVSHSPRGIAPGARASARRASLPRAKGAEIGVRTQALKNLASAADPGHRGLHSTPTGRGCRRSGLRHGGLPPRRPWVPEEPARHRPGTEEAPALRGAPRGRDRAGSSALVRDEPVPPRDRPRRWSCPTHQDRRRAPRRAFRSCRRGPHESPLRQEVVDHRRQRGGRHRPADVDLQQVRLLDLDFEQAAQLRPARQVVAQGLWARGGRRPRQRSLRRRRR